MKQNNEIYFVFLLTFLNILNNMNDRVIHALHILSTERGTGARSELLNVCLVSPVPIFIQLYLYEIKKNKITLKVMGLAN